MEHPVRTALRVGCAAASAAVLAACGATANSGLPQLPAPVPARPGNPGQSVNFHAGDVTIRNDDAWTLPLDSYDSAQNWRITDAAVNKLAQQCMAKQGLTTPAAFQLSGQRVLPLAAIYGVLTMSSARANGYRVLSGTGQTAPSPPTAAASATAQERKVGHAYFGDPQHSHTGCRANAADKIGMQKAYDAFGLVQNLRVQARAAAWSDPRVQRANAVWSSCMKAAGYTYPDPTAPTHDKALLGRGLQTPPGAQLPPPSKAEKAAAVADVTCKRRGNYAVTVALVTSAYQNLLIAQQSAGLQQEKRVWRSTVETARKIIASGR
ncbi:hypothetical protein ABT288_31060 [Streptomyces sp. NPDC001093]|uniref:hypothetical protein n=1 Tax=Streptomyces sp. NPDC001093 TaxID=3154376 RepID=UPI00332A4F4B